MTKSDVQAELVRIKDLLDQSLNSIAEERASALLEEHPEEPPVISIMCQVLQANGDNISAANLIEKLHKREPENIEWLTMTARAVIRSGQRDKAASYCKTLLKATNNSFESLLLLVDLYERNNMVDECAETLEKIPKTKPPHYLLSSSYARLSLQKKDYEKAIEYIEEGVSTLNDEPVWSQTNEVLTDLWFLKAKAYDRMGEYDKSWSCAKEAHNVQPVKKHAYSLLTNKESIPNIMTRELMDSLARASDSNSQPLFIVGQPRSGTSLMEQILGMHPDLTNGGEMSVTGRIQSKMQQLTDSFLPWPKSMVDLRADDANTLARIYEDDEKQYHDGSRKIITNKALNLSTYLGMLSLILPKSRAVMLHRHPLDNCVSCYTTNLRISGHTYTANLEILARVWLARRTLQEHWKEVLDIKIMDMHYETLVADQENETRRLIDFLDLPWDDRCLEFHKSTRTASTCSYDQVNQKMYKTSSGRWKNYEKHLGPVIDLLEDHL